jgi:molybdate transport system permease protein
LPVVLPPVVAGLTLLLAFGRHGVVGAPLHRAFGVTIPFTTTAVVLAEAFVSLPFLVLALDGALQSVERRYDSVAATLGASRLRTFWQITLPLVTPALLSGVVLCWARALGEFGATITFAGSLPGVTETLPLRVFDVLQTDPPAAIALGLVLVAVAAAVLAVASTRPLGRTWP